MAAVTQGTEPNLFSLEGDGATVSYSTGSIAGVPQFSYADQKRSVSRSGDEIRTVEAELAELGKLVTVDIEQVPDLHTITLTLILPRVRLPEGAGASTIHTIGVLTTDRANIAPQTIVGQMQTYRVLTLCGTAQLVAF
jgi:hypothetical protein